MQIFENVFKSRMTNLQRVENQAQLIKSLEMKAAENVVKMR